MSSVVYRWRLSSDLKAELQRQAVLRGTSVSSILRLAVREWLNKQKDAAAMDVQAKLHRIAMDCIGIIAGRNPQRAETVRAAIRRKLRKRRR